MLMHILAAAALTVAQSESGSAQKETPPNIVVLFADDLGYGDLSCYGHPTIRTPHLDRMAAEGMRFTQFYSAAEVCTPSRAGLLTGRLPIRSGMCSDRRRVLFPDSSGGLPDDEITIAEALKGKGYATACIGKWHLGHLPQYLPTRHGFDFYFGVPYSNDMHNKQRGDPPVPLMRGEETIEQPVDQTTLTQRYTTEAVRFIRQSKARPFFLYVPHTFPHVPLFVSEKFRGTSRAGLYGDVVEELDWSVGQILQALRDEGLSERTLVIFTSDNGPWLTQKDRGGSAGLLRDGKGSTWEGGMREPAIAWWPGTIKPGSVCQELATTMDIFTTSLTIAGVPIPSDRTIDGKNLMPVFRGGKSECEAVYFYRGTRLMAVRKGPFKAHFITQSAYGPDSQRPESHDPPLLFNLDVDPAERFDVAKNHPNVLTEIAREVERHLGELKQGKPQLDEILGK